MVIFVYENFAFWYIFKIKKYQIRKFFSEGIFGNLLFFVLVGCSIRHTVCNMGRNIDYPKKIHYYNYMLIEFKQSAFTRNISEANIRHAFFNPNYDGPIEEDGLDNRFLRLGFDMNGNLLEIMYNV